MNFPIGFVLGFFLASAAPIQKEDLPGPDTSWMKGQELPLESIGTVPAGDIPRRLWIAKQHLRTGKFREAVSICNQIVNLQKDNVEAHALLAAAYRGLGREEEFKKEKEFIEAKAPDSPTLYLALADVYLSLKDTEKAEAVYKKGLKVASDKVELYMGLGDLYLREGKLKEASDQYRIVLKQKGLSIQHFLNASFALCRIGLQRKEYDDVIRRAKMLVDLYPPIVQGYTFLGAAYIGKGKLDSAVEVYRKLMEANPRSPVSYQELALLYIDKLEDTRKALYYAEECTRKFPHDARSHDVLGWVYFKQGRYSEALEEFKAAVRTEGKNPLYLYHLGLALQKSGNKLEAKRTFEKALSFLKEEEGKFVDELKRRIRQCK